LRSAPGGSRRLSPLRGAVQAPGATKFAHVAARVEATRYDRR
jgi:hypothetical protein